MSQLLNFINYIKNNSPIYLKNLNSTEPNRSIYVMKFCNSNIINNFIRQFNSNISNSIFFNPISNFFMAVIPKNSVYFVNLFCCKITMEDVYSKFNRYGLAIEGCFNIDTHSLFPFIYHGIDISKNHLINVSRKNSFSSTLNSALLMIDNHQLSQIIRTSESRSYRPKGTNVQYTEGFLLYYKGKPFMDFSQMKNIIHGKVRIDGRRVKIDYDNYDVIIDDHIYLEFTSTDTTSIKFTDGSYRFEYEVFFRKERGLLLIAFDVNGNIIIINHQQSDLYNMMLLLSTFNIADAIMLCTLDANVIWKENGFNTYNKTDFLGNPKKIVSNVIAFSS